MSSPTSRKPTSHRDRILVVEDDDATRRLIQLSLTRVGYQVIEAAEGGEAIRLLEAEATPVLAILCDLRMPGMRGEEAIRYFRAHHPSIPIVVLTVESDTDLAVSLLKQGVRNYVVKPISSDDLVAVIQKAVAQASHPASVMPS